MAYVYYRGLRRPNEVSVTVAGGQSAIKAAVERSEREGNEVMGIIPPPTHSSFTGRDFRTQMKANRSG
jgi:hypothetical protein